MDDTDLQRLLHHHATQRRRTATPPPGFDSVLIRRHRPRPRRLVPVLVSAGAVSLLVLAWPDRGPDATTGEALAIAEAMMDWSAPTDVLLEPAGLTDPLLERGDQ